MMVEQKRRHIRSENCDIHVRNLHSTQTLYGSSKWNSCDASVIYAACTHYDNPFTFDAVLGLSLSCPNGKEKWTSC